MTSKKIEAALIAASAILTKNADRLDVLPMSEAGFEWAKKTAKRLGLVQVKHPRTGGPVFRRRRKTDAR